MFAFRTPPTALSKTLGFVQTPKVQKKNFRSNRIYSPGMKTSIFTVFSAFAVVHCGSRVSFHACGSAAHLFMLLMLAAAQMTSMMTLC